MIEKAMLILKNKNTYQTIYCFNNRNNSHDDGLGDILYKSYATLEAVDNLIQCGNIHTLYPDSIRHYGITHKYYQHNSVYKDLGIAIDDAVKSGAKHIYIYMNNVWRHTPLEA